MIDDLGCSTETILQQKNPKKHRLCVMQYSKGPDDGWHKGMGVG